MGKTYLALRLVFACSSQRNIYMLQVTRFRFLSGMVWRNDLTQTSIKVQTFKRVNNTAKQNAVEWRNSATRLPARRNVSAVMFQMLHLAEKVRFRGATPPFEVQKITIKKEFFLIYWKFAGRFAIRFSRIMTLPSSHKQYYRHFSPQSILQETLWKAQAKAIPPQIKTAYLRYCATESSNSFSICSITRQ